MAWFHKNRLSLSIFSGMLALMGTLWLLVIPFETKVQTGAVDGEAQATVRASVPIDVSMANPDYERALADAQLRARPVYFWDQKASDTFRSKHRSLMLRLRTDLATLAAESDALRARLHERQKVVLEQIRELKASDTDDGEALILKQSLHQQEAEISKVLADVIVRRELRQLEYAESAAELYGVSEDTALRFTRAFSKLNQTARIELAIEDVVGQAMEAPIVLERLSFEQVLRVGLFVRVSDQTHHWQNRVVPGETGASADWERVRDLEEVRADVRKAWRSRIKEIGGRRFAQFEPLGQEIAASALRPTLNLDLLASAKIVDEGMARVPRSLSQSFRPGDLVVRHGEKLTPVVLEALKAENVARANKSNKSARLGMLVWVFLLGAMIFFVLHRIGREERRPRGLVLMWCTTLVLGAALSRVWFSAVSGMAEDGSGFSPNILALSVPLVWAPMMVAMFTKPARATWLAVIQLLMVVLIGFNHLPRGSTSPVVPLILLFSGFLGAVVGGRAVRRVRHRSHLFVATLLVAMVQALANLAGGLALDAYSVGTALSLAASGLVSGLLTYVLLTACIPLFEWMFRLPTNLKLLELCDMNNPLLRQLSLQAPGTYNHSLRVAELSERAADSIGADGLLCRTGSYYHDIGKARNAAYFAENQAPDLNPHDDLQPSMSALVIRAHVKDGIEIARRAKLPEEIIDFIPEHHGKAVMTYFYDRAKGREMEDHQEVAIEEYRHIGPRPQRRETAIVLLADTVEAATRALSDPNAPRIRGVVRRTIREKFLDGQLDECDLTLKDLTNIEEAFVSVLRAMHHHRPVYPKSHIDVAGSLAMEEEDPCCGPVSEKPLPTVVTIPRPRERSAKKPT